MKSHRCQTHQKHFVFTYLGFQSSPLGLMKDYINYLRKEAFRAALKHVGYRLNAVRVGGCSFPLVIRW